MQDYIFKIKFRVLYGVIEKTEKPELSLESLYSGKYQTNIEKYISENYGFREPMIRFYNQYLWDFFKVTPVEYIVLGKDDWMFFKQNVNEYYGTEIYRWYDSSDEARQIFERNARLMNKLRHVLSDYGIELMAFEAPEKGFLYSEYLPERKRDTTTINATEFFKKRFKEYDFPFIGMTDYYLKLKDSVEFPLFAKYGFHWNISCVYAADSLFRMMESLTGNEMPHLSLENFRPLTIDQEYDYQRDNDIEQTLNLMHYLKYEGKPQVMADVRIKTSPKYVKPRMFFIGDSFLWRIQDFISFDKVFGDSRFWYYNSTAFSGKNIKVMKSVKEFSILREMFKSDYIVYFSHGSQIHKLSFGFAERALIGLCVPDSVMNREIKRVSDSAAVSANEAKEMIYSNPELIPELRGEATPTIRNTRGIAIAQAMNRIEKDPKWMYMMKVLAYRDDLVVDTVMHHEALNIIDNKPLMLGSIVLSDSLKQKYFEHEVDFIIKDIKEKPDLMEEIRQKAITNGNTFEDQLVKDARWIFKYKNGLL